MTWADTFRAPSNRTLREFAAGLALVLVVVSWLAWHHGHDARAVAGIGAIVLLGVIAARWPAALRPVFIAASVVAFPIGWAVSTMALTVLFYAVVTPIGLVARALGRDRLLIRRSASRASYWRPKPGRTVKSYYRQF
jgi:polyferredoxin